MATTTTTTERPAAPLDFAALLREAIEQPGTINRAYFAFHGYSLANQLLALWQCAARGIDAGPIATFPKWKEYGRYVRKGEKALTLCMPVTCKRRPQMDGRELDQSADEQPETFTRFIYRPRWFVLSQTDGAAYQPNPLPAWSKDRALASLQITEEPFTHPDGNCFGYARAHTFAVSPLCPRPWRTTFHELAHIVLGHTDREQQQTDGEIPAARSIREIEAEGTAYLVAAALELPGAEDARGYLQHYAAGQPIEEHTARRIFKAADQILRAGQPQTTGGETEQES
jgi:hypothetical protein